MNEQLEANVWAGGDYCYLFKKPKWFDHAVPCKGKLGFFTLPEGHVKEVDRQLSLPGRSVASVVGTGPLGAIRARRKESHLYDLAIEKSEGGDFIGGRRREGR